jgi:hypothetical protein
VTKVELDE